MVKLTAAEGRRIMVSGNLRHAVSHLYVHPEGGSGVAGTRLILYADEKCSSKQNVTL